MGATLPVLARFLMSRQTPVGVNLSTLYSTNTFGAVTGVLATGFFLIGRYGVHIPVYIAVAGNLLLGLHRVDRIVTIPETACPLPAARDADDGSVDQEVTLGPGTFRIILLGLGISGFTSFAYEIYWTRSLVFILGNSTYALTDHAECVFDRYCPGRLPDPFPAQTNLDRSLIFGWIQIFLGVFSALALPLLFSIADPQLLSQYLTQTSAQVFTLIFTGFGIAFLVMLVPATLIGATFPLVGQIAVKDLREYRAHRWEESMPSTRFGNVLGALLPGFLLSGLAGYPERHPGHGRSQRFPRLS